MKTRKNLCSQLAGICSAAVMLLSSVPLHAFAADEKTPSGLAFSEIQIGIEQIAEESKYASFSTAVICGDELLYTGAFGDLNREDKIAAETDSVYEWGSISKTLTWISVMQLWEQGKLDLNKDVREYLPDGFFQHLTYDDPITMMNLMNHNAGFCETTYQIEVHDKADIIPLDDALKASEPAQVHRPGEVLSYSNWGAALAGYIVELISGENYTDYVHHHIFEPLGMEHTSIAPDVSDNAWVEEQRKKMHSYIIQDINGFSLNQPLGERRAYILLYPAGAAMGTISDMTLYMQALADDSAPLFAHPETQQELLSPSSYFGNSEAASNLHGFWSMAYSCDTFFHNGGTDACSSYMAIDPETKVGVAILTNQAQGSAILNSVPELIFGKLQKERFLSGTNSDTEDISGIYVMSRSTLKGVLKWRTYLSMFPVKKESDGSYSVTKAMKLEPCGNGLYILSSNDGSCQIVGAGQCNDGKKTIQALSMDYVQDSAFYLEFGSLIAFAVIAVIGFFLLFVKFILILVKKRTKYAGAKIFSLAQFAKLVSLGMAFTALVFYASNMGMTHTQGVICGITQAVCALICGICLLISVKYLLSKQDDKAKAFKYILNIAVNGLAVFVIIFFEMYRFWGC